MRNNYTFSSLFDESKEKEEIKVETGEMLRDEEVDYQVGDFVYHETFGTYRFIFTLI